MLDLDYEYGSTASVNNGNVTKQTITVPTAGSNPGFAAVQNYTYDSLNRLSSADEKPLNWSQTNCDSDPTKCWKQTFVYDRYGNRTFDTTLSRTTTIPTGCPAAVCNPSANASDNKLKTSDGYVFDNSGNTTEDAQDRTFVYDAENKQTSVSDANGTIGQYWYDGDGKRIKKYVPPSGSNPGETTIFVYGAAGKLVAEYSTVVAPPATAKISYLTNDHLGSPRITTDAVGQVNSRRDFMPFGEEIARASYGADSVRQKFTGYERDSETGLDYAQARYFASGLGRFTIPDPMLSSGLIESPQSWNRYVYASNNPMKYVDPLGLYRWKASLGGDRTDEDILNELNDLENEQEKRGVDNSERIAQLTYFLSGRQDIRNALAELRSASADPRLSSSERADITRALNAYGQEGQGNVNVGISALGGSTGATTEVTTLQYGANGRLTGFITDVTFGSNTTGQALVMAVAHEGSHVADNQEAYGVWIATGDQTQARNSPLNATKYSRENRAYHVSAAVAKYQDRNNLTYRTGNQNFTIWTRGMQNVDQTVLDGLLSTHPSYGVTPQSQGIRVVQ